MVGQAGVSKEAYEYLNRGVWYSWGEAAIFDANGGYNSRPRDLVVFGQSYEEDYRINLDTGEYELILKQNYHAEMKNGQCIVIFPDNKDFYYAGKDGLLHCYIKSAVDGEWLYSGTNSLKLDEAE